MQIQLASLLLRLHQFDAAASHLTHALLIMERLMENTASLAVEGWSVPANMLYDDASHGPQGFCQLVGDKYRSVRTGITGEKQWLPN